MARLKSAKRTALPESPRYINRELSWLEFNRRVLYEASRKDHPLLERIRFLAIFESNLDEFYMVRVSGLVEQFESGLTELTPDGLTPAEQLEQIHKAALPMRRQAAQVLKNEIEPELLAAGISVRKYEELSAAKRAELEEYFVREVFPVCTPLILHPNPSVPFISSRSVNLAVELEDSGLEMRLARVKIPTILPRLVKLRARRPEFVMLDDVVARNLKYLFPGVRIRAHHSFRVIRDADIEIREIEAADLLAATEETILQRRFGDPVRIDVNPEMPEHVLQQLLRMLQLEQGDVFAVDGPLGLEFLEQLANLDRPALRFPPMHPFLHESLATAESLFESIKTSDVVVHQPFDSFKPVELFVASATEDKNVIGIKQTLYRVGSESPVVESLLEAAEQNKQVAAMVELKARFDESNNLIWARQLERAGVHVTYGFRDVKTHAKLCLIVRREKDGIVSYAHIGTGNYNPVTARLYTDFGLFTDDPDMTQDIAELFNFLTGFSKQTTYRKLLVAPQNLREEIIERIEREIKIHKKTGKGRIIFKLNSLVDPEIIDSLYDASRAGIPTDLIIRGICCLRPGVPGLSENLRVISIVGRFLEHSRAYYFENGGTPELYIGSADLMRRNLDRRIEVLAPVRGLDLIEGMRRDVLEICLKDTANAWSMKGDGTYVRIVPARGTEPFDSHKWLIKNPTSRMLMSARDKRRAEQ